MPVIKLNISGQVQGVGYRYWFAEQAQALGLKGYVKNLSTGEVEAVIAGTDSQLQEMIHEVGKGLLVQSYKRLFKSIWNLS